MCPKREIRTDLSAQELTELRYLAEETLPETMDKIEALLFNNPELEIDLKTEQKTYRDACSTLSGVIEILRSMKV